MESKEKQGSNTHAEETYTRCMRCGQRAYLVKAWRPERGLDSSLRQFECENKHLSYKSFKVDVLFQVSQSNSPY